MATRTAKLLLNSSTQLLYAYTSSCTLHYPVKISSGLLSQLQAGTYTVAKPVSNPLAGLTATASPSKTSGTPVLAAKVSWRSKSSSTFLLADRALSGSNQLIISNGSGLLRDLQKYDGIVLSVV